MSNMQRLKQTKPLVASTTIVKYDIMCNFSKYLRSRNSIVPSRAGIPDFHVIGHNRLCQLQFGRSASLSARDKRKIVHEVVSGRQPNASIVHRTSFSDVSVTTIYNALNEAGYTGHMRISKPLLTSKHKAKRLDWARAHQWTAE